MATREAAAPTLIDSRCWWAAKEPIYHAYHDDEWGRPTLDDVRLFEKLALEGFQAGLSWLTILRKRDAFRRAFRDFDPAQVARFDGRKIERLLADPGIVRHRGKIEATIHNARIVLEIQRDEGSLAALIWRFAPRRAAATPRKRSDIPVSIPESHALAAALRQRGFRFIGPTTAYAFMQAMGLVNDHVGRCPARLPCAQARARLRLPSTGIERPVSSRHARDHGRLSSHQASRHLSARR